MAVAAPRRQHIPDILDCLAQLSNDEVPTPPKLARAMLDLLPAEVWRNPDYKWLDPSCKSGAILREVATRLLKGLAEWEPDWAKRRDHIFKRMLFGTAVTEMTGIISRRSVYCSRDASGPHSVVRFDDAVGNLPFIATEHAFKHGRCTVCGAPEGLERGASRENYAYAFIHGSYPTQEMQDMKFDVIVGNPPYQIDSEGNTRTKPVYQLFVEKAIEAKPRYLVMITPSRWFSGGLGLDEYRDKMIADRRLSVIVDNPKVFDCFPGVKIEGGVSYFLWDRDYDDDCHFSTRMDGKIVSTESRDLRDGDGVLVRDNQAATIIRKVTHGLARSAESEFGPQVPFGLRTNYGDAKLKRFAGAIPIVFGSHVAYVKPSQLERNVEWVNKWKVLVPMAFGDGRASAGFTVLGEPIALAPGSACTQTYFIAGMFDTREETENYAYYLATKFVRFLVLQRKTTQHLTPDRFRFVPMLDMTRRWTDEALYKKFKLSKDERDYIEKSIKPRSVNLSLDSPIPASHLPGGSKYRVD